MDPTTGDFTFQYHAADIYFGHNRASDLNQILAEYGLERALVVCGQTVGTTPAVMNPITDGVGERLAGVFDETEPSKAVSIARAGAEQIWETTADCIVSLGGGSSLDLAKAMTILHGSSHTFEAITQEIRANGVLPVSEGDLLPIIAVPTTLAGADLSTGGSVTLTPESNSESEPRTYSGGFSDTRLMPTGVCYDPALFATTPDRILASSAMNGFDKGIEMLYSTNATPITDATAVHGLKHLTRGLPDLRGAAAADQGLHDSVIGTLLVQFGLSSPGTSRLSIIHAFGHALSRPYDIQQGAAHAIMAPHALRLVFDAVDGRRSLLASAVSTDQEAPAKPADTVIESVTRIRDRLKLPRRLQSIPDLDQGDLPSVAEATLRDPIMKYGPPGLDPTKDQIEAALAAAW